jgi:flavin-dependent dehydrogenase
MDTSPIDPKLIDERFDVIVIGAGIAGNTQALSLSAQGLRVLLLEASAHPRFRIGESTIPSTSAGFKQIGLRFGVPELSELTTFIKSKELVSENADAVEALNCRRTGPCFLPEKPLLFRVSRKRSAAEKRT